MSQGDLFVFHGEAYLCISIEILHLDNLVVPESQHSVLLTILVYFSKTLFRKYACMSKGSWQLL